MRKNTHTHYIRQVGPNQGWKNKLEMLVVQGKSDWHLERGWARARWHTEHRQPSLRFCTRTLGHLLQRQRLCPPHNKQEEPPHWHIKIQTLDDGGVTCETVGVDWSYWFMEEWLVIQSAYWFTWRWSLRLMFEGTYVVARVSFSINPPS